MLAIDTFIESDNERDGNLAYNVKEGYSHNGMAHMEYFYNALSWVWKGTSEVVKSDFPVNRGYYSGTTLGNLSLTWYRNINVAHTVEICNYFKDQTLAGNQCNNLARPTAAK